MSQSVAMESTVNSATPMSIAAAIGRRLKKAAHPDKAGAMQAYAKSSMPYFGVQAPALRQICDGVFSSHPLTTAAAWRLAIAHLWDTAAHKELRYAAIELAAYQPYQRFISMALVPLYRRLVQDGAWWDTVDALAGRVAVLLAAYPVPLAKTLRAWAKQDNIWLRRVAIIAQVGARDTTDQALLYDCIGPSIDSKQFFLRKAIGWALREYAKANPGEVRRYLGAHQAILSPLSVREAEKGFGYVNRHGILKKATRSRR